MYWLSNCLKRQVQKNTIMFVHKLLYTNITISDNVLVFVGFYIGSEKKFDGYNHFALIGSITVVAMFSSEIVAKLKKTKVHPTKPKQPNQPNQNSQTRFVIGNLIPFTNLNMVFAFGIFARTIIDIIWTTKYGFPKIAIQTTFMLICLLLFNADAKTYFKRRLAAWRAVDMAAKNNKVKPGPSEDVQEKQVEMQDENQRGDDNILQNEENREMADAGQICVVPKKGQVLYQKSHIGK